MTNPASISTLSEFLLQAQTQYMVFDLGRGIRRVDNQTFFEWENQQAACQFPRQDHAWFCIVFWNDKLSEERYIWFIKLPVDELGLMVSAALHQFLDIIIQALGKELQHTENKQAQLPDNPFVFTPSQQQLADCNAHIRHALGINPRDNSKVRAYMQAPSVIANEQAWASLTLQDIADYVIQDCELGNPEQDVLAKGQSAQASIAKNITLYAPPVLSCIFASLESVEVEPVLVEALIAFHQSTKESNLAVLCLRAMSYKPHSLCINYLFQLINENEKTRAGLPLLDLESCVVISGRYWQLLTKPSLLAAFMHKVAILDPSFALFKGLYADLVKVPESRESMLAFIRYPERSKEVSEAIGALFSQ